jgi:arylsulfatase A-like enzyme
VPLIVSWPGHFQPAVYDKPVIALDFTATALAAAGMKAQPDWKLEGVDLTPYFSGANPGRPHDTLYWRFGRQMAIRDGDYKLVRYDTNADTLSGKPNQPTSPPRLYKLSDDIGEANDLAATIPEKVKELDSKYEAWNKDNIQPRWTTGLGGTGAKKAKKKK